jgi:DNA ligase-1
MTRLSELVETSRRLSETGSRLEKIGLLADLLTRLEPEETVSAVAFLAGELRQGRIGIGHSALRNAVPRPPADTPTLTVLDVDRTFEAIAGSAGRGSSRDRVLILYRLLARATREEQEFLSRLIMGELRQGALEGVMTEAIAKAASVPTTGVRRALMFSGDLGAVARAALTEGGSGLARFDVRLGHPIQPMLAQTAESVSEAVSLLGVAAFELKLDGARVQVHKDGQDVRVFTRRLNDVTAAVPEIVESVRGLPVERMILDGETLALRDDGKPEPFQTTMRRFGRRLEVGRMRKELPLTTFFFDCLYLDGESLVDRRAEERFVALSDAVKAELRVPRRVSAEVTEAESFLRQALAVGHEGVMAKALDAPYEAGARGRGWLKVKMAHTLDLVVLAAEWGHGRRRGWLSNLHLGARDGASGQFVMLGKTFKGLTDETLTWQTKRLQEIESSRDRWTVYVRPEVVVEIAFNDIQASPQYPGGVALRFARVKRYRPDKSPQDADTLETVRAIFEGRLDRPSARRDS